MFLLYICSLPRHLLSHRDTFLSLMSFGGNAFGNVLHLLEPLQDKVGNMVLILDVRLCEMFYSFLLS